MNPLQALDVLNIATQPANLGKLSRGDFYNCEMAIAILSNYIKQHEVKAPEAEVAKPKLVEKELKAKQA